MSAEEIKALERRWFEAWSKGKAAAMAAIDEYCVTDFVYHSGSGGDIRGLKDLKQYFSGFYDAFPDQHYTLDDLVVEGNKAVGRYTFTGTHKGAFMGIPPTNRKVRFWGIWIDFIRGGRIVEEWQRYDTLGFMQQLGVVPTPKK